MKDKLLKLQKKAYAPYSKFRVSAIVVMKDGKEFYGVNVENSSYGVSMCAERVAIFSAVASGYKKNDFVELYVMTDSDSIATPCFACRQVINEFFDKDSHVVCMDKDGNTKTYLVSDICPYPFGEDNLK